MTGQAVAELAGFDQVMTTLMQKWRLPGGQLAVAKNGRLVLNRGYGLADVEHHVPVQPASLFRVASVTKTITAVAILTLVDAGLLSLEDQAFPLLGLAPASHATIDPRLDEITVEQVPRPRRRLGSADELRSAVPAVEPDGGGDDGTG